MRSFTYQQGSSSKFWNIELSGKSFTVTYGRIGTKGQTQTKTFKDEAAAQKEHDKLVKEKLGKGYVETTPTAKMQPSNLREALEAALVDNPDDLGNHMAYADYLQEQGDPRGEFIQLQLALEDTSKSPEELQGLRRRMLALLRAHQRAWLGPLALLGEVDPPPTFYFRRGWLDYLHVPVLNVELARALVCSPPARLLRQLAIDECKWERTGGKPPAEDLPRYQAHPATYVLARSPFLGNVRVLHMGRLNEDSTSPDTRYHSGPHLLELLPRLLRLEELNLNAHDLESEQLFATPLPPTLRVLRVNHLRTIDHALSLARSGLLKQLKILQLNNAGLTDVAAGNVARCLPQPQLELLDLSHNHLTFAGEETLRATGVNLDAEDQTEPPQRRNTSRDDDTFDAVME